MFDEEDLLPIAALGHLAFCERRWGLMYLEGMWADNRFTVEGQELHERVDEPGREIHGDLRIARGLRLRSLRLGLSGRADVVEFHPVGEEEAAGIPPRAAALPGVKGLWRPFPVEYKRGNPRPERFDEVQLCAQALCLEEMLGVAIEEGAIFYGRPRRRYQVSFDDRLRKETEALAARLHALTAAGVTPPAQYRKECRGCSLLELCMPKAADEQGRARRYLLEAIDEAAGEPEDSA